MKTNANVRQNSAEMLHENERLLPLNACMFNVQHTATDTRITPNDETQIGGMHER